MLGKELDGRIGVVDQSEDNGLRIVRLGWRPGVKSGESFVALMKRSPSCKCNLLASICAPFLLGIYDHVLALVLREQLATWLQLTVNTQTAFNCSANSVRLPDLYS